MKSPERQYIPEEAIRSVEEEKRENPLEEQASSSCERVKNNDARIENLISQLPEDARKSYASRVGALRQNLESTLLKIEVKLAYLTNRAFLPGTREKIALIKEMVPHFKPMAVVHSNILGGSKEYENDFEKIQDIDSDILRKLVGIKDFIQVDSANFVNENYDLSTVPGFVDHFSSIENQQIRTAVEQLGEQKTEVLGKTYLHHSAFLPFIINFERVENKQNLARFSAVLQDYFSKITRHDTTKKGVPTGGGALDPRRLPRFLVENSQLELTDDKLNEFFSGPESEDRISKFILENHPWLEPLSRMLNVQGQAEKQEFNLWINDLIPLVKESINRGLISFDSRQDAEILLDYVKTFGMKNTPELFEVFVNLKRVGNIGEVDPIIKKRLKEELGIDADEICEKEPTNVDLVINEIVTRRKNMLEALKSEDENLPDQLCSSKLSADLFNFVKGTSPSWKKKKSLEEVLSAYQATRKKKPELFTLKDGYEKAKVEIPQIDFGEITDERSLKEKEKILTNPDLARELARLREAAYFSRDNQGDIQRMRDDLENTLLNSLGNYIEATKSDYEQLLLSERKNDKALIGVKSKLESLESSRVALRTLMDNKELDVHDLLKNYQKIIPDKLSEKREAITKLSLALFNKIMPGSTYSFIDSALATTDEEFIKRASAFLSYEVREHILNRKHDQEIAGQIDPEVTKAVKRAWGLTDKNIIIESGQKLSGLAEGRPTGKTRSVSFVPSRGLQKVFSGNIGNSCIDSQEEDFAKGKFEGITSYSLVLDEGKPAERFAGIFLLIETKTENGEPILIIRGNNPSENLFSMIDGDVLIKSILDQTKKVAEKRGIKHIAVPLTDSGRASSNREAVAQYYKAYFAENTKVGLVNNVDTNFNTYPIWDKNSSSAVVLI